MMSLRSSGAYMHVHSFERRRKEASDSSEVSSGALRVSRASRLIDFVGSIFSIE